MKGRCFFLLFVAFLFGVVSLHAGEFALRVDDISGLDNPWPLVASLAFPEGELKDVQAIRIMSGGREVSCQVDVAALWRDGSIRWALAGFTSSPAGQYRVEYGPGMKRSMYPNPLKVTRHDGGGLTVETGAAVYRFDSDKLMPEEGWLVSGGRRTAVLEGSGSGAYLVDNSGRTGRISGAAAEVENTVLKEGPGRFVIKRSGWYVTDKGEKLARADAWFYFSAGTPHVKITHSLILTEDTNKIWIRDYGLEFRTPDAPGNVYLAEGQAGKESIRRVEAQGEEVYMLQDTYPHFAERESRAVVGKNGKPVSEFQVAGDWAHGDYGRYGITLVMPWLAERFPKEISFGPGGARAVLWSNRSGRELDFRSSTLAKEYWQSWVEKGYASPGREKLVKLPSNAQGAAGTHDVWFMPGQPVSDSELVRKEAVAAARSPLVLAEPQWLCKTEALGVPMHHRDTARFPKEEEYIADCWDRLLLPNQVFPMNGYINWGHSPYLGYLKRGGQWVANFQSYGNMNCYFLQRHAWYLYARSGERRYFDYGHRYNRITGDYALVHWDAPDKPRGTFIKQKAPISALPHYWGNSSNRYDMYPNDIGHWPLEYYLTGDERSRDITMLIGDTFKKNWNFDEATNTREAHSFLTIRKFIEIYKLTMDEFFARKAKELADVYINMDEQTGIAQKYSDYGCPMYKDQRHVVDLYMYYRETGDEPGKQAFLKILDHRYRFNRNPKAYSYQSIAAFAYPIAYGMTGNENYLKVAAETMRCGFKTFPETLEEELKKMPANPDQWQVLPNFGIAQHTHPFMAMPAAMKFFRDKNWESEKWPVLVKSSQVNRSGMLFSHTRGNDTVFNIHVVTPSGGKIRTELFSYPISSRPKTIPGIKTESEQRILIPRILGKGTMNRDEDAEFQYHVRVTVPSTLDTGFYLLYFGGTEAFTVLDATTEKVALYCPEGFWTAAEVEGDGWAVTGQLAAGRLGEDAPFFFRVPEGLENLEIFLGRPQIVKAPDGTVVVEGKNENTGRIVIPVRGRSGTWSLHTVEGGIQGAPLVFTRLLNVEPVVAFGSPDRIPEDTGGKPVTVTVFSEPSDNLEFVEGVHGKGLRLAGKKSVSFPAGDELEQGGYRFFPGIQGTVEFWFKPDWSTQDIALGRGDSFRIRSLLEGPHAHLGYRYGARFGQRYFYSDLILELLGELSGEKVKPSFTQHKSLVGREERHLFRQGEWNHIAYTWAFASPETAITDREILGEIRWPVTWRIFGPVDRNDPVLSEDVLNSYPEEIKVAGRVLKAVDKVVRQTTYEFPGILKGEYTGRAAYIFLKLNSSKDQEVTLGMGADWWMQAWLNGKLIHDTTVTSNIHYPFSIWNHMINVRLKKGENILAVRYIRSRTSILALGGPGELRKPEPAKIKWEFAIFVNGRRLEDYRNSLQRRFLREPKGNEIITLAKDLKDVTIGPLDGTMDMLRVSDTVRYNGDFTPPATSPAMDKNTRALFLFDGDLKGTSAFSKEAVEAK